MMRRGSSARSTTMELPMQQLVGQALGMPTPERASSDKVTAPQASACAAPPLSCGSCPSSVPAAQLGLPLPQAPSPGLHRTPNAGSAVTKLEADPCSGGRSSAAASAAPGSSPLGRPVDLQEQLAQRGNSLPPFGIPRGNHAAALHSGSLGSGGGAALRFQLGPPSCDTSAMGLGTLGAVGLPGALGASPGGPLGPVGLPPMVQMVQRGLSGMGGFPGALMPQPFMGSVPWYLRVRLWDTCC